MQPNVADSEVDDSKRMQPNTQAAAQALRILIVEDSEDDVALLLRELRKGGYQPEYRCVCTADSMRAALANGKWDIIVSDWSMPHFTGLDAFRIVRESKIDVPFIIVSGTIGEEVAVEALRAGVQDFMTKGKFLRLVPAIERELREHRERCRRRDAEERLERRGQEIAESEQLLRLVIESVPDGVAVVDGEGEFVVWNRAAENLIALTSNSTSAAPGNRHGVFAVDRVTAHEVPREMLLRTVRGEEIERQEVYVRHAGAPEGSFLTVHTRLLRDVAGKVRGAVGVFRDVSRERAANEQLLISDRMASIGMLAAGVAHEINNPLAAVMANLELVQRQLGSPTNIAAAGTEIAEMLADARVAAERVRQIVRDLKIFARHEDERPGAVEINAVLDSAIRMAWNEIRHRAQLIKDFGPAAIVKGTESRLGQVFLNLIINAAQAIPEGKIEENLIRVGSRVDKSGQVVVEVSDSGSGISVQALSQLFRPFFTTKPVGVGTGLGLAICHRIVSGLGGEIQLQSELGKGTTVRVLLAPATAAEAALGPDPATTANTRRRGHILVVDDEPSMGSAIVRLLRSEHHVRVVDRAVNALRFIAEGERFDVILCDLMMPQMTGMDLYAVLASEYPDQAERMIFMTGGAFTPAARSFLDDIGNQVLDKPFDREQLRALINSRVTN
jgi:PAS domain S-box-containing protein